MAVPWETAQWPAQHDIDASDSTIREYMLKEVDREQGYF